VALHLRISGQKKADPDQENSFLLQMALTLSNDSHKLVNVYLVKNKHFIKPSTIYKKVKL